MNVQPITDSKNSRLKWLNHPQKNRFNGKAIDEKKKNEFLPDFTSPDDILRLTNTGQSKEKKSVKSRPLSSTSENWIG
jgi:hypothetical protein